MNKGRRHELKMLKYKRRLKIYAAKNSSIKQYLKGDSVNVNNHALRTTGKPCSCEGCSPEKYKRSDHKEPISKEVVDAHPDWQKAHEIYCENMFEF